MFLNHGSATYLLVGPIVNTSDVPQTTLSLAASDVKLSKANGSLSSKNSTTAPTHDSGGYYLLHLDNVDLNTVGRLLVSIAAAGCKVFTAEFQVVKSPIFYGLFGGGAGTHPNVIPVDVSGVLGTAMQDNPGGTNFGDKVATNLSLFFGSNGNNGIAKRLAAELLTAATAKSKVVEALGSDTYSEPSGAPGATVGLLTMVQHLYFSLLRNKTSVQSGSPGSKKFYDDAGNVKFQKSLTDASGVYTEDEAV